MFLYDFEKKIVINKKKSRKEKKNIENGLKGFL